MAALLRSPKVEEAPCRLSFSQSADTAVTSEASDTISEFSTPKAASVPDQVRPTHMDERLDEQVSPTDRPDEDGSHAHTMIIERLEAELATLRASIADEKAAARQEGFSAGFDDGVAEGRAQFEEQVARVKAIAEELAGQGDALRKTHQDELVEVVVAAVTKILGKSLATEAGAKAAIRNVIKRAADSDCLKVSVSVEDYDLLKEHTDDLLTGLSMTRIELVGDESIRSGGCTVEGKNLYLDGRVEVQLESLYAALIAARKRKGS